MNSIDILKATMPSTGPYFVQWFKKHPEKPSRLIPKGKCYVHDLDELLHVSMRVSEQGYSVFHRMANFKQAKGEANEENAKSRRSFHIDIDVGEEKGYPTRKEAARAVVEVVHKLNLPQPIINSSGGGFHLYWPLAEDIPWQEWKEMATSFRALLKSNGLKFDYPVSVDAVRFLRAVGTTNYKYDPPRPVKNLPTNFAITPPDKFAALIKHEADPLAGAESVADMFAPSTDLVVTKEYRPSDADAVARHCSFVGAFKEHGFGGGGKEPSWWAALGVVKHCIDGVGKCHEFGLAADNYDPGYTDEKIENWDRGPTTCEYIEGSLGWDCSACPHRGNITSPIQLGEKEAEIEQLKEQAETITGPWWPKGYGWDEAKHQMYATVWNEEEEREERVFFSTSKFYVETRVLDDSSQWAMLVHRLKYCKSDGTEAWESFTVETKLTARPTDLAVKLAEREVYMHGKSGNSYLSGLFKAYGDSLRMQQKETATHRVMGWHSSASSVDKHDPVYPLTADGFVIGNKLVTVDGVQEIILSDKVKHKWRKGFGSSGTPAEWARFVHNTYVKPDLIPYQFIILTDFASPLASLFCKSEYHGNVVAISGESGWAKTSTSHIGLSIWGNPKMLEVSGNPKQGSTTLSFMRSLSTLRHIGPLLDEVTKQPAHIIGEMIYAIIMGESRERLGPDGNPLPADSPWSSFTKITSNNPIMHRVAEDDTDSVEASEAIQRRLFEVNLDRLPYERSDFVGDPDMGMKVQDFIASQYGTIGPLWVRYILEHMDEIVKDLDDALYECKHRAFDAAGDRFHDYFEAAMLVTCKHVSKAGLMHPNTASIQQFISDVREDMLSIRVDTKVPMVDSFARYMSIHRAGIIVTKKFPAGKGRPSEVEYPMQDLHGEVVGRIAIKDQVVAMALEPIRDWCRTRGLDFSRMMTELDKAGYVAHDPALLKANKGRPDILKTATQRVSLGSGTTVPGVRAQCVLLDYSRIHSKPSLRSVTTGGSEEKDAVSDAGKDGE